MDQGQLVPDAVVIGMIRQPWIKIRVSMDFYSTDFPARMPRQMPWMRCSLKKNSPIQVVLALQVSKTELIKRLLNRGLTSGRTDDVNESVIGSRIEEYERKTAAVADHYKKTDKVVYIPGEGTVDQIFRETIGRN